MISRNLQTVVISERSMISTIVFSKERPLQLFAYIESLMYYSGLPESSIHVLYRESNYISYDSLRKSFPKVNWIVEQDFYRDLMAIVSTCDDYILWGCDDVFFKSPFNPQVCAQALASNEQLLAFSLRLGRNIEPIQPLQSQESYWVWDWTTSPLVDSGWAYPWEVSASIYRKNDVIQLLSLTDNLQNPNLLEGLLATYYFEAHGRSWRKQLACFELSKSVALQINQVQNVYQQNEFEASQDTTTETLYHYFIQGKRLDWKFFENCQNSETHVGLQYFRLCDAGNGDYSTNELVAQNSELLFDQDLGTLLKNSEIFLSNQKPESPEHCLELAKILVLRGCPLDAVAWCHYAITLRPQWAKAYQQLGYTYQVWGLWGNNFVFAESAYKKAISLDPQSAETYHWLGSLYQENGNYDQAIKAYCQALFHDPALCKAHWNLGNLLHSEGRFIEAIKHHTYVLRFAWNAPLVDYDLMTLCNQGHVETVLPYALESIRRGLHNLDACNVCQGIVANLICQGDYRQAVTFGLKILQYQPAFLAMRGLLREALENLGRKDDAMSCLVGMVPHHVVREFAADSSAVTISFHDKKPADTIYSNVAEELPVYLPPAKGSQHRNYQFMVGGAWNYSSKKLVTVSQGTVWSDPSTTAVFSSAGELLEDLSYGNSFLVASSRHLPQVRRLNGTLAVLAIRYSENYCHWMFEFVARAALLKDAHPSWEKLDGILLDPARAGFQVETLKALGIPEDKLIFNQEGVHLKADQLIIPSPFSHWPVFDPTTCQILRSLFLQNPESTRDAAKYPKRIYLTRSEATYRRVLNDAEVQTWLASAGFVSVTLSQMSVAEQATTLSMAEVVVAPHGAGLTNLVFCKPGTKVLEIFPHNYSQPYYWALANQCKLAHRYLVGRPPVEYLQHQADHDFSDLEDIVVDLNDLTESLMSLSVHFPLDTNNELPAI